MKDDAVNLVQQSFCRLARMRAEAGRLFYERLFEIAPELRPMFKADITAQSQKLVDTLAVCVELLQDEQMLVSTLRGLGERHAGYGARPEHYARVREALLWTVEKSLGPACRPEVMAAWSALYDKATGLMLEAAESARAA